MLGSHGQGSQGQIGSLDTMEGLGVQEAGALQLVGACTDWPTVPFDKSRQASVLAAVANVSAAELLDSADTELSASSVLLESRWSSCQRLRSSFYGSP